MTEAIESLPDPLRAGPDGVIRVGRTRVTLDTIIAAFTGGATANQIAEEYPVVALADIESAIAFYLAHKTEVEAYLRTRAEEARRVRGENESRFDPQGIRERLESRSTAPDSLWQRKVESARRQTFAQKFMAGAELFDDACAVTEAGIRMQHPEFSDDQVRAELRRRIALGAKPEGKLLEYTTEAP
ncbi:MAG TPA: DUF433 domain-containing protein [Tepidisphaeraceae bacterium]|jgi:uncharacterized protein (DUF433 family)